MRWVYAYASRSGSAPGFFLTEDADAPPIAAHRKALAGEAVAYEADMEGPPL